MEINIKLGKTFTTKYNELQRNYANTSLPRLNGFDVRQLSYTDFIDNFVDQNTVADASIDGNSNVSHKDIVTLEKEMPKPHEKLLAFNKIYYEMQKKYGTSEANKWLEAEYIGELYMHDANTATFKHYCYKGDELITIKYQGQIYNTTIKKIINFCNEDEIVFDPILKQNVYYPKDLYIRDQINNKIVWTQIKRYVAHNNDKPMRFIKMANGNSFIVTEDHPCIVKDGDSTIDIPAAQLTLEDALLTIAPDYFDNTIREINVELTEGQKKNKFTKGQGTIILTKELGWLTGMVLSEGTATPSSISLKQSKEKSTDNFNKLLYLLNQYNIPYRLDEEDIFHLKMCPYTNWLLSFCKNTNAATKALPKEYIHYNYAFLDGVLAGMIDGDGVLDGYKSRQFQIRIASEELIHQLTSYLNFKNIFTGDRTPFKYQRAGSFAQRLPLFGCGASIGDAEDYFLSIQSTKIESKYIKKERHGNFKNKKYNYSYGWVKIIENSAYIESCPIVYDITTESGHFIANNILSHNCFAYDLKDLAERGLYFIDGRNAKPAKHLITFVDFIKEFVSYAANRSSGAVGLPNLIPYLYYFWKKDMDNHYLGMVEEVNGEYYAKQAFQRFIYAVNQPYCRDGSQSAFTNTSVFDHPYFEALFGGSEFPDGSFMIDSEEEIIQFQKWYMEEMSDIRTENMFTFPVSTISLLRQNGKFVDEEFAHWAIKHNMRWSDSNIFVDSSVNSLSNCCRLKSDIRDLGYFNSVGGTALKVGSVKVSTVNLARIALDSSSEEEYLEKLKERTWLDLEVLDRVRYIIKRNVEKGLLPNFSYGLVDFKHLYNTIGFIGIYETMKKFGYTYKDTLGNTYYDDRASLFGKKIFDTMRATADKFIEENQCDYHINTEQIPGETAAAKLMKKDQFFYPEADIYDLPLYGNQFMPLGIQATLAERVRVQALFDSYCNGGSILHANIDAPFNSFEKAWKMTNYIADQGVTYFAFNTKIQACEENHAFYGRTCPVCGKPVETEYTRIVGFYTPIKTWGKERKQEYKMRRWADINKIAETTSASEAD